MMEIEDLRAMQAKFNQGLDKLKELSDCLGRLRAKTNLEITTEPVNQAEGELSFWFAGTRYYVRIRITDRNIDDIGADARIPLGWLDWGRYDGRSLREPAEQTNYFDDRGILCELDKEEFYCNFQNCNEERLRKGMLSKLQRLVGRTVAVSNAGPR